MSRIRILVAALAVGSAAVLSVPTAAHAADQPVVNWAHSDFGHDLGTLLVSATAPSGIAAITAHILTYDTHQEVGATSAFTLREGTAADGVWASAPILLDNLGVYLVDVEVTADDGQHVRQDGVGDLVYAITTFFDGVSLNRTTTTYEDRTVTLSGMLKGRQPGSGVIVPVGGEVLTVLGEADYDEVTTRSDGTFTGTVDIAYPEEVVQAIYNPFSAVYTPSVSDVYTVGIAPRPVRVTATADKNKIDKGESVTVSGQVSWLVDGRWVPLAGVNAFVLMCANTDQSSCNYIGTAVTDADGRYTYTTTPYGSAALGVTYVRYAEDGTADPYTQTGFGQTKFFTVRQPSGFTSFYGGRYDHGLIGIYGYFAFNGGFAPGHFQLELQYSANGEDGWHTYATFLDQYSFQVTGVDMPRAVYWRAVYSGDKQFQPATSDVVFIPAL